MSNWADELIANQLGFPHCVLFPRAREAIRAWTEISGHILHLPANVCPVAEKWATRYKLHDIDETGLAPSITTQLYGYREIAHDSEMDLDPLGTGFFARPCATSAIVSFGAKKFVTIGGAAFVTKDLGLAQEMEKRGYFPPALVEHLQLHLRSPILSALRERKFDKLALWDRYLGDSLQRINREQVIPWRVMRLASGGGARLAIVVALRQAGFDVGMNYPPLPGHTDNGFGSRVLNFFLSDDYDDARIRAACEVIWRAIG